jgi:hypothetical protein
VCQRTLVRLQIIVLLASGVDPLLLLLLREHFGPGKTILYILKGRILWSIAPS